ncbi:Helix-turn-helix domain-containing protein, partial [Shewanella morhuae]|uniref:IS30 family transposase n=1 Tax=Shewanella morhuae TaxID=365591 RepID=UPI000956C6B8
MNYQQLTEARRYQISVLLEQGFSIAIIAKCIHCHRSSVYREIKRCQGQPRYNPKMAHQKAVELRRQSAKYTIPERRIESLLLLLQLDWSPEQISHVLSLVKEPVNHEWIYRYIARNKRNGGKLYRHLRQGHKRYRRGKAEQAPTIKNAVSIDERPAIVDSRERFVDWEIDTVLGQHGTGAIVTILERKTRFYLIKKVNSKSAEDVTRAT